MTTSTPSTRASHIHNSRWHDIAIPDVSLPELLLGAAAERGDHPALVEGITGRSISYAELAAGVRRVAAGLAARGLRKGDVVAILTPNMPEWPMACYGAMTAGGVVTGINPLYTPAEIAHQLAGARFVFTVPPFLAAARAAVDIVGGEVEIILLGPPAEGTTAFADLLAHGDTPPPVRIDPATDLALLPYSSGTSGLAKGVMLTHRACVANVLQMQAACPTRPDDRALAVAPFFHATGFGCVANVTLYAGATVVTMPRFDVEQFLGLIESHRITNLIAVPSVVLAMAKHPAVDRFDLSSLRWVGCGAAPLGAELQLACSRRLGRPVEQGYGMTELTALISISRVGRPSPAGSVGLLVPGLRARVVDTATGVDLGTGETGELWLRGPAIMTGYRNDPDATAATIDAAGWLHTGDIARFDDSGALYITDRVKELIKVKGFQVAPAELEAVLRTHPSIIEAAVVPVPDERAGERPKAFVVRGDDLDADEVKSYVAERVAPHKRLGAVEFVDAITRRPTADLPERGA